MTLLNRDTINTEKWEYSRRHNLKAAVLFAGQGSQAVGMARDLYENQKTAKDLFDLAENVLKVPLKDICFNGPDEILKKTENTQPAVLLMSFICYKLLEQANLTFDAYAGFSLGEYSALAAAGVIKIEDALLLVRERGLIMEKAVPGGRGGMAAILGMEDLKVEEICKKIDGIVVPANYNSPGQIVISGEKEAVEKACKLAEDEGALKTVILNVSGPFHSPLLNEAGEKLKTALDKYEFNTLHCRNVCSNVTGGYQKDTEIKDMLVRQLYSPVRWRKIIENLIAEGFDTFIEVGPGKVLTGFMRSIDRKKRAYSVNSMESLNKTIEEIKKS
jgi:[acyl-carrier-protein] S-malonyltransferase